MEAESVVPHDFSRDQDGLLLTDDLVIDEPGQSFIKSVSGISGGHPEEGRRPGITPEHDFFCGAPIGQPLVKDPGRLFLKNHPVYGREVDKDIALFKKGFELIPEG
jgi:hypothetical protein